MGREKCICRFQGAVTAQEKEKSMTNYHMFRAENGKVSHTKGKKKKWGKG